MTQLINLLTRTSTIRFVLVIGMITLTAAFILGLFFHPTPDENKDLINMALVGVLNWTSMIVATYYNKPTPNVEMFDVRPRYITETGERTEFFAEPVQENERPKRP